MHRVHTLNPCCVPTARAQRPGCTHSVVSWRALGLIVAPSSAVKWPCRGSWASCRSTTAFAPGHDTNFVSEHRLLPCALPCVSQLLAPYRGVLLRRIAALLRCIVTQRSPPSATIQNFVSRPSASQAACARCRMPLRAVGRVMALPGRVVGRRVIVPRRRVAVCPAALYHDTICCIVTQPSKIIGQ